MKKISLQLLLLLATIPPALSQTAPPYKQVNLPIEERVKDLFRPCWSFQKYHAERRGWCFSPTEQA